jgi:homoserine trans-succinylase
MGAKRKKTFNYNYCNQKIMKNYKKNELLIYVNRINYNIYQKVKP